MHARRVGSVCCVVASALAACAPDPRPDPSLYEPRPPTPVDCVAVLGALNGTMVQTPLAEVPRSGLNRDKTIAELDDTELRHLCDFDVCLRVNGYLRKCYPYPSYPPPLSAGIGYSCFPNTDLPRDNDAEVAWGTRQDCVDIYRNYFGRCHVGVWEDCAREGAVRVLASSYHPSCDQAKRECPIQ